MYIYTSIYIYCIDIYIYIYHLGAFTLTVPTSN